MHALCKRGLLRERGRSWLLGLSRQAASTAGKPSIQPSSADSLECAGPSVRGSIIQPGGRAATPVVRCHTGPEPSACLCCGHEHLWVTASLRCWHWERWASSLTERLPVSWEFKDPTGLETGVPGGLCWLQALMSPQGLISDWKLHGQTNGC